MRKAILVLSIFFLFSGIATADAADCENFYGAENTIKQKCEQKYYDDFSMQEYCVREQIKAIKRLEQGNIYSLEYTLFDDVRKKCCKRWDDQYNMRVYCEAETAKNYFAVLNYDYSEVPYEIEDLIKDRCFSKYLDNYTMQKYCLDQQINGWLKLNP